MEQRIHVVAQKSDRAIAKQNNPSARLRPAEIPLVINIRSRLLATMGVGHRWTDTYFADFRGRWRFRVTLGTQSFFHVVPTNIPRRKLMNDRYFRLTVSLAALIVVSSVVRGATTFSTSVPVDTSWRAIGPVGDLTGQGINNVGLAWEASHVGWNTLVAFDASDAAGWKNAIAVAHPTPPLVRYWVDGTETIGSSPAYFRKVFNIPGVPQNGSLDFNVDDDAKIYVNGQLVFTDSDSLATDFTGLSVSQFLHSGLNLVAVKAQDQQGAQSIQGQLNITYVPEPSALALLMGASVLPAMRRPKYDRRY
jgi:hypothetical protein